MRRLATLTIIFSMSALLTLTSLAGVVQAETPEPDDASATEQLEGPKISMSAVGTNGGYFELDAEPGERLVMNFEIANTGDIDGTAIIFASDAYTMVNGGFDARHLGDSRTGPTEWLDFTSEEVEVGAGQSLIKTVTLDVPDDIEPGEHMTSLVMQDRDPEQGFADAPDDVESGFRLEYVSRHAIPIFIKIPGPAEPGLEIGEAEHAMSGGNSAAKIEVNNPGNVRVLPEAGGFRLEDDNGFEMLTADASMKLIFAGHETHFQINLGELLEPGDYWVWLELADENKDVSASGERLSLHVPEPPVPEVDEDGGIMGLIQPPRLPGDGGSGSWWILIAIIVAVSLMTALLGVLIGRRRRGARLDAASPEVAVSPALQTSQPAKAASTTGSAGAVSGRSIRPLSVTRRQG